jgi:hypothetical protein
MYCQAGARQAILNDLSGGHRNWSMTQLPLAAQRLALDAYGQLAKFTVTGWLGESWMYEMFCPP